MKKKAVPAARRYEPIVTTLASTSGGSAGIGTVAIGVLISLGPRGRACGTEPCDRRRSLDAVVVGAAGDLRDLVEVVYGHRRRQLPLERPRMPRVGLRRDAGEDQRVDQVADEDEHRGSEDERRGRDEVVQRLEVRRVRGDAPWHVEEARGEQREEGQVEE